jgi:hypothetical protein
MALQVGFGGRLAEHAGIASCNNSETNPRAPSRREIVENEIAKVRTRGVHEIELRARREPERRTTAGQSGENRRWVPVPNFAVSAPDRFGDGRSHVCSSKPMPTSPVFLISCFSPTGSKS